MAGSPGRRRAEPARQAASAASRFPASATKAIWPAAPKPSAGCSANGRRNKSPPTQPPRRNKSYASTVRTSGHKTTPCGRTANGGNAKRFIASTAEGRRMTFDRTVRMSDGATSPCATIANVGRSKLISSYVDEAKGRERRRSRPCFYQRRLENAIIERATSTYQRRENNIAARHAQLIRFRLPTGASARRGSTPATAAAACAAASCGWRRAGADSRAARRRRHDKPRTYH
jgi:hypothetical protein